ncbi:MAG: Stk1 family PASTA domain-containing Ser/Thr kinase [Lachnospiraceae bacterium]|nr:Stk1 family PASTA domain-containing Ser/Thr kinase [Lachnospiraceae bacterium]MEE3460495.1 Stk1 family PASTA domain-containing Ser/Thr kinase [Lachnospiraceae bacterium]
MIRTGMMLGDRYEITDKVGSGGMADVYKARDTRLNRMVAIKILKPEYSTDEKFVSKFKAEAQSVAGISHPNIVNVYDVGEDNDLYYIVMELVVGITLKKFIEKKGRLDVNEAVGISIQIARGMKAAHDNHIIHRDIKPQNIIISKEGKVKVTDFGIAKAATSNTITSNAMGSVHYISPEQARGGYSDERSDIYSLGVSMYEMFSGSVPFEGESTVAVALSHIQDTAVPLDEVDPDIPHSIAKIVEKCMQKKPEMRYQSAEELIADLKRSLNEPDGRYVHIVSNLDDSPTRKLTDEDLEKTRKAFRPEVKPERHEIEAEADPDADEAVDPRLDKIIKICSALAAVIIIAAVILFVGKFKGWWNFGPSHKGESSSSSMTSTSEGSIVVPAIVGLTLKDAEDMLTEKKLKFEVSPIESEEKANQVVRQEPQSGEKANEYDVVTIYYSQGGDEITIPDVRSMTKAEAVKAIEDEGLTVSDVKKEKSNVIDKDLVINTDPVIGSSVEKGSEIVIILSEGPEDEQVQVPNIYNKKESEAIEILADSGLVADSGNVTYVYSDTVPEGYVVSQGTASGTKVDAGTKITYSVSKGPEATPTPKADITYTGNVTISSNPFSEGEDPATIKLVLSQSGSTKTVWNGTLGYDDFPKTFTITGWSGDNGTVTVCKGDTVLDGTYNVEFSESE